MVRCSRGSMRIRSCVNMFVRSPDGFLRKEKKLQKWRFYIRIRVVCFAAIRTLRCYTYLCVTFTVSNNARIGALCSCTHPTHGVRRTIKTKLRDRTKIKHFLGLTIFCIFYIYTFRIIVVFVCMWCTSSKQSRSRVH